MHRSAATSRFLFIALCMALAACAQQGPIPKGVKVGKPYVIEGKTYYPAVDTSYDKVGDASWYGPGFHGKYTANGEIFNQNDLTAAHPTLPMPSIVRVTNLENGRSAVIRINDRGPFKKSRIIDLSKKSAERLGVHSISKVRVQYLGKETEDYMASVQTGKPIEMAEFNNSQRPAVALQIVESTVSDSDSGQPVNDAAPVMTVGSTELPGSSSGLISEAIADEHVASPLEAPKSQQYAEMRLIQVNPNETITETETPPEPKKIEIGEKKPATKEVVLHTPAATETVHAQAAMEPSAGGSYTIQAGAFSSEQNAKKLVAKLSGIAKGIIHKIDTGGNTWWRVRAGSFSSRQEAEEALQKMKGLYIPDARIIRQ